MSFRKLFLTIFILLGICLGQEYECDENTVALWHFNEGEGLIAFDECSSGFNGEINGPDWTFQGQFDDALVFNIGSSDYVQLDSPVITSYTGTIEAWVWLNSWEGVIFNNLTTDQKNGVILAVNPDGAVHLSLKTDGDHPSLDTDAGLIIKNKWYHIAAVFDSSQSRLAIYVNGSLVSDSSYTSFSYTPSDTNARIGQLAGAETWAFFDGKIDEVRISDVARDSLDFQKSLFYDIGASIMALQTATANWGDYDNDGDLDLLITGETSSDTISMLYDNNDGIFSETDAGLTDIRHGSTDWGDYDNDGDLDILLTGDSGEEYVSKIYQNDNGIFSEIPNSISGVRRSSVAWGDYDNDGDLDVLITGDDNSQSVISKVYRNDNGSFVDISSGLVGVREGSVEWGDYDNDGDMDILLTGDMWIANGTSKIYRNDHGIFEDIDAGLQAVHASSAAWGDYDNDGDLDIVLTGYLGGRKTIVYKNEDGIFSDINANLQGLYISSVAWGDYDNDGDLDLLLTGEISFDTGISKIYRNDGDNNFIDIGAELIGMYSGSSRWGDYDNDGDLDIVLVGRGDGNPVAKIYQNNTRMPNTIPSKPTNLLYDVTADTVTLSWNASSDSETPTNGLSYNIYIGESIGGNEIISSHSDNSTGYRRVVAIGNCQKLTSWSINNLSDGSYVWSVQAIDQSLAGSEFATESSFSIPPLPKLKNLVATPSDSRVELRWLRYTEFDFPSYRIYRGTNPWDLVVLDSLLSLPPSEADTIYIDAVNIANGTVYYYRIVAFDNAGLESPFSEQVSSMPTTYNPGEFLPDSNTVALWHFDENSDTIVYDYSGYSNHGLLRNNAIGISGPSFDTNGILGGSILLDTLYDYIEISNANELDYQDSETFTVEIWVNWNGQLNYSAFYLWESRDISSYARYTLSGEPFQADYAIKAIASANNDTNKVIYADFPDTNVWVYYAAVFDGFNHEMVIYRNGVAQDTTLWIRDIDGFSTGSKYIGNTPRSYAYEYMFYGNIDEMRISNIARHPDSIRYHYEDATPPSQPQSLIAVSGVVEVDLQWNQNPEHDVAYYQVFRRTTLTIDSLIATVYDPDTTYIDYDVVPLDTFVYRITAVDDFGMESDSSDTAIVTPQADTQSPTVNLVTVLDSAQFLPGDTVTIEWNASDNTGLDSHYVSYSLDGGVNFTLLDTLVDTLQNTIDTLSIEWTVPDTVIYSGYIKIVTVDVWDNRDSVQNNIPFSIGDFVPPYVQFIDITIQNDSIGTGDSVTIRWSTSDNVGLDRNVLTFSSGMGIEDTLYNGLDTLYEWETPDIISVNCELRLTSVDTSGNDSSVTFGPFTIFDNDPPLVLSITTEPPDSIGTTDSIVTITWTASDNIGFQYHHLWYSDNTGQWFSIDSVNDSSVLQVRRPEKFSPYNRQSDVIFKQNLKTTGNKRKRFSNSVNRNSLLSNEILFTRSRVDTVSKFYNWVKPDTVVCDSCRVKVISYDPANLSDSRMSEPFRIYDNTPPSVELESTPDSVGTGDPIQILWSSRDNVAIDRHELFFSSDGGITDTLIKTIGGADSLFDWTIPDLVSDVCLLRIVTYDYVNLSSSDTSDNFTIFDNDTPQVSIHSPTSGFSIPEYDSITVTWEATDNIKIDSVRVYYSNHGGTSFEKMGEVAGDDTSFTFGTPMGVTDSAQIELVTVDVYDNEGTDYSDFFSVTDNTEPNADIINPDSGTVFDIGSIDTIKWIATDNVDVTSIDLFYSVNNGVDWDTIVIGEPNDGTYLWLVPNQPSNQVGIRLVAYDAIGLSDTSEVIGLSIVITYPTVISVTPGPENRLTWRNKEITFTFSQRMDSSAFNAQNLMINSNYSGSVEADYVYDDSSQKLNINLSTSFASLDTVSIVLKSEGLNNIYGYGLDGNGDGTPGDDFIIIDTTAILSDYDLNDTLDVRDLVKLVNGWREDSLEFELGPIVSGDVPHFIVNLDGEYNIEDGMAFVMMWNWCRTDSSCGSSLTLFRDNQGLKPPISASPEGIVLDDPDGIFSTGEIVVQYDPELVVIRAPSQSFSKKLSKSTFNLFLHYENPDNGINVIDFAQVGSNSIPVKIVIPYEVVEGRSQPVTVHYQFYDENGDRISSGQKALVVKAIPESFSVSQNYPNPFNPITKIDYSLPVMSKVNIVIYNLLGQKVKTLINDTQDIGYYSVKWYGKNDLSKNVGSGLYIYRIDMEATEDRSVRFDQVRKMLLLR